MASEMPVVNAEFGDRPTIEFPTEIAPAGLKVVELFEGNGPMVRRGDTVTVNYHGVVWGKDTPFDSSFDRHQPATFGIGVGQVIKGWDRDRSGTQRRFPPGGVHSAGVRLWLPWRSAGRHRRRGHAGVRDRHHLHPLIDGYHSSKVKEDNMAEEKDAFC